MAASLEWMMAVQRAVAKAAWMAVHSVAGSAVRRVVRLELRQAAHWAVRLDPTPVAGSAKMLVAHWADSKAVWRAV